MMKYYVALPDGTREGPFDNEEINAKISHGNYKSGCLVWHKGMNEWEPIENHFSLNSSSAGKKVGLWVKLLGVCVLLACGIGGYVYYDATHITIEEARERLTKESISPDKYEKVLLESSDYSDRYDLMECILLVCNVEQRTKDKALKNSIKKGWLKNCEVLLNYHADLGEALDEALDIERKQGFHEVSQFVKKYAREHAADPVAMGSALVSLIRHGHAEFFFELIEETGVDVNVANEKGETPLMMAACHQAEVQLVAYLLQHGADPEFQCKKGGDSVLSRACLYYGSGEVSGDIVQLLIQNKANVNAVDDAGYTCLMKLFHYRVLGNRSPEEMCTIVKCLIDAGADVNATTKAGVHLLAIAEAAGYVPVMQLLAEHGSVNTSGKSYSHEEIFKD